MNSSKKRWWRFHAAAEGAAIRDIGVRVEVAPIRDIPEIARIRSAAYGRRLPEFGRSLAQPEPQDWRDDAVVLVARSVHDGSIVGSVRLHTNAHGPLQLEEQVPLPPHYRDSTMLECWRINAARGEQGRAAFLLMIKAVYKICLHAGIDYVLALGRRPIDQIYRNFLFEELLDGKPVPFKFAWNIDHTVFGLPVRQAAGNWRENGHPLHDYVTGASGGEIRLDLDWIRSRFFHKTPHPQA